MKAIVQDVYGGPEALDLRDIDVPVLDDDRVLIKVHAASVNPVDWHSMTGLPYIARLGGGFGRPKLQVRGTDAAGVVEAVGSKVTTFKPGDEVFGGARGAFAEYATARAASIALKPAELSYEHAAAIPVAALTALQALRDKAHVQPGQHVLVNGAAGGVGTFTVQIAKALGAKVTGVCSRGNVEMVTSLGADRVIDYTAEDFVGQGVTYDVIIDNVGNRTLSECRRVLTRTGTYVVVSGPKKNRVLGPASRLVKAVATFAFVKQKAAPIIAKLRTEDLDAVAEMIVQGKVAPVIDRSYSLEDVPEAMRYLATGHAKGKLVVTM